MSTPERTAREFLVKRLNDAMQEAGFTVAQLAEKTASSRTYLTHVTKGRKNFTLDEYEKWIKGCGWSFDDAVFGKDPEARTATIPRDLFRLVDIIAQSKDSEIIQGVMFQLGLAVDRVIRSRASPGTERAGEERMDGRAARRREHKSHNPKLKKNTA